MIGPGEHARIIFGCGNFGGLGSSPDLRDKGDRRDQALTLLDHARDLGLTRFDTANTYGGGVSETVLGEWLRRQDRAFRGGAEVATKVGNPHGASPGERPLSRAEVTAHLDRSLRRLGLERIGLYYLHEFDSGTPLTETLEALERALAAGKIGAWGVSNATLADLQAILALADGGLGAALTHVQNEFNLLIQRDAADVIPLAVAHQLRYVAFSPLAGGLLSGKYSAGVRPQSGRLRDAPQFFERQLTPETFAAIDGLAARAAGAGISIPEAALRCVLDTPGVDALIIAPRSLQQFDAYGLAPA